MQKIFHPKLSLANGHQKTKTKTRKANEEGTLKVKVEGAMPLLNHKRLHKVTMAYESIVLYFPAKHTYRLPQFNLLTIIAHI